MQRLPTRLGLWLLLHRPGRCRGQRQLLANQLRQPLDGHHRTLQQQLPAQSPHLGLRLLSHAVFVDAYGWPCSLPGLLRSRCVEDEYPCLLFVVAVRNVFDKKTLINFIFKLWCGPARVAEELFQTSQFHRMCIFLFIVWQAWVPCPGLSTRRSTHCGLVARAIPCPHSPTGPVTWQSPCPS